jgi:hypothetical protein
MRTYGTSQSTVTFDYNTSEAQVFFLQAQNGNFTFALNNLPTTEDRVYTFVFVTNNTTAGYPSAMTINASGVTIRWAGATAPTPSTNGDEDIYTITVMRRGSDSGNTSAGWFIYGFASLGHQ